jgi:hypothetical protein
LVELATGKRDHLRRKKNKKDSTTHPGERFRGIDCKWVGKHLAFDTRTHGGRLTIKTGSSEVELIFFKGPMNHVIGSTV